MKDLGPWTSSQENNYCVGVGNIDSDSVARLRGQFSRHGLRPRVTDIRPQHGQSEPCRQAEGVYLSHCTYVNTYVTDTHS